MKAFVSLFVVASCLLVLPGAAMAATYTVDSTGDQVDEVPGSNGCKTAVNTCTLRAAIEESDFSTGVPDEIKFSAAFEGKLADTIALGSSLPPITDPVSILGGDCFGEDGPDKPCAGVEGPSGAAALIVESANEVAIEGLSVTGAQTALDVIDSSEEFTARNDWIGVKLDGSAGGNGTGIFVDPGSDGAVIGGTAAAERNVISNSDTEGLDLQGASDATVQGNYFGVAPDGLTTAANATDIEMTDSTAAPGFKAEDNEIGATIEGAAEKTAACDGGCNVISGATGAGIDLNGHGAGQNEAPASGPTLIHGNFVGVSASGTGTVANGSYGVLAGHAENVTIGEFLLGDANYFAGSSEAIATEEGEGFIARGNSFGIGPGGAELTRPGKAIFALDQQAAAPPSIEQNLIFVGSVGIEQRGGVGRLTSNEIIGGSIGIYAKGEPGGGLIATNFIAAASENGILVEGPANEVRGNTVLESGEAGIRVKNPPGIAMTGGLIGGNSGEKENVIEDSGGPAIEIVEEALEAGSVTEIARNHGSANKGLFIDLVNGANEGIVPPAVAAAAQSKVEGTAEPGATIRVFRKASVEAGELGSLLAETVADGSGNWKVTFPVVAAGTLVTATQTVSGATSQLATPIVAQSESSGGGGSGGSDKGAGNGNGHKGNGNGNGKPGAMAPQTTIRRVKVSGTTAKFKFTSNTKGAKFECKLDKQKFKPCKSPKAYEKLKPGKHVFKVRAVKGKSVDPTPAKRKFKIAK